MVYSVREDNKDIYSNTDQKYALSISDYYRFVLPLKQSVSLNHIDLFFKIPDSPATDPLHIDLLVSGKILKYVVALSDLGNDSSLRLTFDDSPIARDKIGVVVHVETPVQIWVNSHGPCAIVNGDVVREIEIKNEPLISIVTPIYKPTIEHLKQTIESVIGQVYPHWELCLVDDGSNDRAITEYLRGLSDPRIKVKIGRKNHGICSTTNIALRMTTGIYTCFLDHDDLLTPDALLEVATVLDRHPTTVLVYSDEDKVKEDGTYVEHFYKPDWSYSMLLSQNYICHLSTYITRLLKEIGGVRKEYEGSQDHDMLLRYIERIDSKDIWHIPRILYHWRKHDQSTSSDISNKPYAHIGGLCAVRDHLRRVGEDALVTSGRYLGSYNVEYRSKDTPSIHIIVPTRDNPVYLRTCCFSIEQSIYKNYTVTIVDNGSVLEETKKLFANIQKNDKFRVLSYDRPFNFSEINNYAVKNGPESDLLLFLNDDTEVIAKNWMERLSQHIGRDNTAIAGAKLLYGNNAIQHAGVIIGCGGIAGHSHKKMPDSHPGYFMRPHVVQNVSAVTGACLMISSAAFKEIGGFEEGLPKAFNDVDLCLKVRDKGYRIVYDPYACLFHHESVSRGLDNSKEAEFSAAIAYMNDKWHCSTFVDPYYNPNLTLASEVVSYRVVP